ncbi:hypothetical protein OTU49_008976, partial [Cherax quadricarinatus]
DNVSHELINNSERLMTCGTASTEHLCKFIIGSILLNAGELYKCCSGQLHKSVTATLVHFCTSLTDDYNTERLLASWVTTRLEEHCNSLTSDWMQPASGKCLFYSLYW